MQFAGKNTTHVHKFTQNTYIRKEKDMAIDKMFSFLFSQRVKLLSGVLLFSLLFACGKQEIVPPSPLGPQEVDPRQPEPDAGDQSGTDLVNFRILADGKEYYAVDTEGTDLSVFVPVGTNLSKLVACFSDNAASVTVNGVEQVSGETANDFRSYKKGVEYLLKSDSGSKAKYTIRVLDTQLPVVSVRTDTPGKINSKVNWRDARIRIRNTDGKMLDLGVTGIRGRGNWTWDKYPKKPYALKLQQRQEVLGMPAHRRWILLALYRGFIGNAMAFEATRRAPTMPWAPRGQFVELVLNGKFQGLYYLCEQIKIDENRINITKLEQEDATYPAVSGGYLLEYDELYDEQYKFKSRSFNLPVQLKSPDDSIPDAQFNYIKDYINQMEAEIKKIGTKEESHYADFLDRDNFAEYWMVLETIGNYEAFKPRSVKMYKGRDGVDSPAGTVCKLKAGPLWDQELFEVNLRFNSKEMYYYKYLFQDPDFVAAVKERWEIYKSNILGNDQYAPYLDYLNDMVSLIKVSANRDIDYWDNNYFTLGGEVSVVKRGFLSKINWMDARIQAF